MGVWMNGCVDEWMDDEWAGGWVGGQLDGWME